MVRRGGSQAVREEQENYLNPFPDSRASPSPPDPGELYKLPGVQTSTLNGTWRMYNMFLGCLATQAISEVGLALQFKAVSCGGSEDSHISGMEDMVKVGKATTVPFYCHYSQSPLEPEHLPGIFVLLTWC